MGLTKGQNELKAAAERVARHLEEWIDGFLNHNVQWGARACADTCTAIRNHDWREDPTGLSTDAIAVIKNMLRVGLKPVAIAGFILGRS